MKKYLFGIIAVFTMSSLTSFANVIVDDPLYDNEHKGNGGVRTITPEVHAVAMGDLVTFEIRYFVGNAHLSISSNETGNAVQNTYYINGHSSFTVDCSEYESGAYTISITLANGQVFTGQLIKE